MRTVEVVTTDRGKFVVEISVGPHALCADEGTEVGGLDMGPEPHDFLLAGLGACTAMTLKMYAERKSIPLEDVQVKLSQQKVGDVHEMTREITLVGDLDEATRQRMLEIANKCPVHKTLMGKIEIKSALV